MIDNEGYKYLYSYGVNINYCLPIKGKPVIYVSKYDYEECNGAYVYNNEEWSITDYDLDKVIFKQSVPQLLFVEYIKTYEELEDEGDINFIEEGKKIFKEMQAPVINYKGRDFFDIIALIAFLSEDLVKPVMP